MKTWFDWMDAYYVPQPRQDGAQIGETGRILALARGKLGLEDMENANAAQKARPARRHVRRLWALVAAAALVLCLGVGGAAAGVFPWGALGSLFGSNAQQQAARLGMPGEGLSQTRTKAGVTLTLEGIVDDGTMAYLPVQLTFEDGQYDPDLRYYVWGNMSSANPAEGLAGSTGCQQLEDPDPTDATVPLLLSIRHEGLQPGDAVELTIFYIYGNAVHEDGSTEEAWSWENEMAFSFTLPQAQPAITVTAPEGAAEPATGIAITRVTITPMRVAVTFGAHPDAPVRDQLSRLPMAIRLTDGSTITLPQGWGEDNGTRSAFGEQGSYTVECEFGTLLDPAAIAAVEVNGVTIPVA